MKNGGILGTPPLTAHLGHGGNQLHTDAGMLHHRKGFLAKRTNWSLMQGMERACQPRFTLPHSVSASLEGVLSDSGYLLLGYRF